MDIVNDTIDELLPTLLVMLLSGNLMALIGLK